MGKFDGTPMSGTEKMLSQQEQVQDTVRTLAALHMTATEVGDVNEDGTFVFQTRLTRSKDNSQVAYEITVKEIEP